MLQSSNQQGFDEPEVPKFLRKGRQLIENDFWLTLMQTLAEI